MPMRTYDVAMMDAPNERWKAHIVTFDRGEQPPVDVALYRTGGGYAADHPRTGYAIRPFDQISRWGRPVPLAEAKAGVLTMLDGEQGYERIREGCARLPVLNPDFN